MGDLLANGERRALNAELAREIEEMTQADQEMRRAVIERRAPSDPDVDRRNTARFKAIVDQYGWPTRSLVGEQAEHMAWLLAQHADIDVVFQERCLSLIRHAGAGEVCPRHLAYLEDRILLHRGRPQRYGTQYKTNDRGEFVPQSLEDPEGVDERRAALGLEPLAAYGGRMNQVYSGQRGDRSSRP